MFYNPQFLTILTVKSCQNKSFEWKIYFMLASTFLVQKRKLFEKVYKCKMISYWSVIFFPIKSYQTFLISNTLMKMSFSLIYISIYIYLSIQIYIYIYINICIYMYVYVYIYIYVQIDRQVDRKTDRHKEHPFAMFLYGAAVPSISYTSVGVSFFIFFIFQTKLERDVLLKQFSFRNGWVWL